MNGLDGVSNGADSNQQQQRPEGYKGMQGDVMQKRSCCMEPTGLPTEPFVFVCLLCEQGAASRAMTSDAIAHKGDACCYLDEPIPGL